MKYRRNFVRRSSRMTSYAGLSRYAGAISNAPVAGLNTKRPQASVRSGAAQLTLTISGAIDVSATSPCVIDIGRPSWREHHYRHYDGYAYERGYGRHGCRTVTIHRDDGSVKQIRRCD